jgi:peptidoglycan/xylan/chitin deacetylase (PgdA/CDA1 family)
MLLATSLGLVCAILLASCASLSLGGSGGQATRSTATATLSPDNPLPGLPAPVAVGARDAALGCLPTPPPPVPQVIFGGGYKRTPSPMEVALTFDDGPTPYTTPPILDELERTRTPATFFVLGQYVHVWPYLLRREWNDGLFAIGVHTWDHPFMTVQTNAGLTHQFGDTLKAMRAVMGKRACIWLWRPPYGEYNAHVLHVAASYGLTTVNWDDAGLDWTRPGARAIANNVFHWLHPGAIILLHDGPANRQQTADALPIILAGLKARGLRPVTLPKLLADERYPGVAVVNPVPLAPTWPTPTTPLPTITPIPTISIETPTAPTRA